MNRQKTILFLVVLALIGGTAGFLAHAKTNQKLGAPGVKTDRFSDGQVRDVVLPADLPGYQSQALTQAEIVTNMLPPDTSYGQRLYTSDDGFQCVANVVLMGINRASIHKPQICLTSQGWKINEASSRVEPLRLDKPQAYELPVMRLNATRTGTLNGQQVTQQGVYVYWFVDADRFTPFHAQRYLWMARDIVFKGELDRWAYMTFFAVCVPGQEDATFERMKKLIVAAVPEFQLVPKPAK